MFGILRPRCPLDLREKVWVELGMQKMVEAFGWERLRQTTVILPTWTFFDPPSGCAADDLLASFQKVCGYLQEDPDHFRFEVAGDESPADATTFDYDPEGRSTLRLASSLAEDQEGVIAQLASWICRDRLHRQGLVDPDDEHVEWFAGLAAVYGGMGVFGANAAVKQRNYSDGIWHAWSVRRIGGMPARMYGYALGLFALTRGESQPPWARALGSDGLDALQRGMRFLTRTGESVFDFQRNGTPAPPQSDASLLAEVTHGSDSHRLAALWALQRRRIAAEDWLPPLLRCIRSRHRILRVEAMRVVGVQGGDATDEATEELIAQLGSGDPETRQTAVLTLGRIGAPLDPPRTGRGCLRDELQTLLADPDRSVMQAAAIATSRYGLAAGSLAPLLIRPLCKSLVDCDHESTWLYLHVLCEITHDPAALLQERMAPQYPDLYPMAVDELRSFQIERNRRSQPDQTA